jgi:hypothetical protein
MKAENCLLVALLEIEVGDKIGNGNCTLGSTQILTHWRLTVRYGHLRQ